MKNQKTVSIYTRSGQTSPSSYYRILQYEKNMPCKFKNRVVVPDRIYAGYNKSVGIKRKAYQLMFYFLAFIRICFFLLSDIISKPDAIFVSRAIMPKVMIFPVKPLMRTAFKKTDKLIWDIDDNIFGSSEITAAEKELLIEYSSVIIVIGDYLKSLLPEKCYDKVVCLLTTDGDFASEDTKKLETIRKARYNSGEVALLWLATYTSLPFVEDIVPYLDEAAAKIKEEYGKQLVLEIVCNRPLVVKTNTLDVKNYVWSKELAGDKIRNAHIGIYPLRYSNQTLGKSGFKLLQYMSIGLATISSAVGNSNTIIEHNADGMLSSYSELSDWTENTVKLASSWENIAKMGKLAKAKWDNEFSYNSNLKRLTDIICGVTNDESK